MRTIVKNRESASLTTHRNTPHCDFDNYAYKDVLRAALRGRRVRFGRTNRSSTGN